jgi:hypothetical protein
MQITNAQSRSLRHLRNTTTDYEIAATRVVDGELCAYFNQNMVRILMDGAVATHAYRSRTYGRSGVTVDFVRPIDSLE